MQTKEKRRVAFIIDHFFILIVVAVYAMLFGVKYYDYIKDETFYRLTSTGKMFALLLLLLYFPIMNFVWGGTLGRLALGLRMTFVHAPNRAVQFFLLLVRNIVSCLEFISTLAILPNVLLAFKGKRLADLCSGTRVEEKGNSGITV